MRCGTVPSMTEDGATWSPAKAEQFARFARQSRGRRTLKEIAVACGGRPAATTIGNWEKGILGPEGPKPDTVKSWALAVGVDPERALAEAGISSATPPQGLTVNELLNRISNDVEEIRRQLDPTSAAAGKEVTPINGFSILAHRTAHGTHSAGTIPVGDSCAAVFMRLPGQ